VRAVLTFHGVDESGSVLSIRPAELAGLVRGIRTAGHDIVPLEDLLDAPEQPDRVAITFDDGFRSVHAAGLPVLSAEGAAATVFLTTGYVGGDNAWPSQPPWAPRFEMLGWSEVEALAAAGWRVESHTVSHPDLRSLDDAALEEELVQAKCTIAARVGREPAILAYPYGHVDTRVGQAARRHHRWAVTTRLRSLDGLGRSALDEEGVPRLDGFYLRQGFWQRRFGSPFFRGYLGARALLRRLRGA
jgi:peptidoglycan/xylan/chitin deacetylase (PgdA/CDA1 family)